MDGNACSIPITRGVCLWLLDLSIGIKLSELSGSDEDTIIIICSSLQNRLNSFGSVFWLEVVVDISPDIVIINILDGL